MRARVVRERQGRDVQAPQRGGELRRPAARPDARARAWRALVAGDVARERERAPPAVELVRRRAARRARRAQRTTATRGAGILRAVVRVRERVGARERRVGVASQDSAQTRLRTVKGRRQKNARASWIAWLERKEGVARGKSVFVDLMCDEKITKL